MRRLLGFISALLFLALPLVAQNAQVPAETDPGTGGTATTGDSTRDQVLDYLAKGDPASAEKVMSGANTAAVGAGGSIAFEEIKSCGFYPQETRLECTVAIKQPFGYGGPIGSLGSFEYVSFFVDWANDGFQITDYVGSGIVHITDNSSVTQFAVYRDYNPPGGPRTTAPGGNSTTTFTTGPILKVLAKLSWFVPVTNPSVNQVWGNNFTFSIRMMPIR